MQLGPSFEVCGLEPHSIDLVAHKTSDAEGVITGNDVRVRLVLLMPIVVGDGGEGEGTAADKRAGSETPGGFLAASTSSVNSATTESFLVEPATTLAPRVVASPEGHRPEL